MPNMRFKCQDDKFFDVDLEIAKKFEPVKTMLENLGEDGDLETTHFDLKVKKCEILKKAVDWLKNHINDPPQPGPEDFSEQRTLRVSEWDKNFLEKVNLATLYDLIQAADFLGVSSLLDFTCNAVADKVRGKTPEEIREMFGIKNDITPEDEEKMRKAVEWCME